MAQMNEYEIFSLILSDCNVDFSRKIAKYDSKISAERIIRSFTESFAKFLFKISFRVLWEKDDSIFCFYYQKVGIPIKKEPDKSAKKIRDSLNSIEKIEKKHSPFQIEMLKENQDNKQGVCFSTEKKYGKNIETGKIWLIKDAKDISEEWNWFINNIVRIELTMNILNILNSFLRIHITERRESLIEEFKNAIFEKRDILNKNMLSDDHNAVFPREKWEAVCDLELPAIACDSKFGGLGEKIITTMHILESLGYTCEDAGLNFSLLTQIVSAQIPIQKYGSQKQKQKYLPDLCSGKKISAHGITEPDSGSDAFSMKTFAEEKEDCFVLNGSKIFITNGPIADIFIIYAVTDEKKGALGGISAFIVEKGTKGFKTGKPIEKMGLRTSPLCELFFDDCIIPKENLIGGLGKGFGIFNYVMKWETLCSCAINIGDMERILKYCVKYAKTRKQYGKKISQFQAVSHKIAEIKIRLETARAVVYKAGELFYNKKNCDTDVAIAKTVCSENYVQSSLDAIQIFGAYGYMKESGIEKYLRNSVAAKIYSGSSEIQRNVIASLLGL